MMDIVLLLIVCAIVALALGIDVGFALTWLRGQWR
jgi:hypothetical protein